MAVESDVVKVNKVNKKNKTSWKMIEKLLDNSWNSPGILFPDICRNPDLRIIIMLIRPSRSIFLKGTLRFFFYITLSYLKSVFSF